MESNKCIFQHIRLNIRAPNASFTPMPVSFKVKLRRVANSLVVSIPREIFEGMNWKEGDELTLEPQDHSVTLKASHQRK